MRCASAAVLTTGASSEIQRTSERAASAGSALAGTSATKALIIERSLVTTPVASATAFSTVSLRSSVVPGSPPFWIITRTVCVGFAIASDNNAGDACSADIADTGRGKSAISITRVKSKRTHCTDPILLPEQKCVCIVIFFLSDRFTAAIRCPAALLSVSCDLCRRAVRKRLGESMTQRNRGIDQIPVDIMRSVYRRNVLYPITAF